MILHPLTKWNNKHTNITCFKNQAAVQDLEAVDFSVVTMARKLRAVLTTEVQQKAPGRENHGNLTTGT